MRRGMLVSWIGGTLLALGMLMLAGCGDVVTMTEAGALDAEEELREFIDDHGFFDETEIYGAEPMSPASDSREAIDPLTFWREVTERRVVRDVQIDEVTGVAEVTVYKEIWGTLNIVDEDMVEYEKPMHHEGVKYAVFERDTDLASADRNGNGDAHRYRHRRDRWTLTAVSGLLANSVETLTMNIDWIRVQSATVDTTITDPSALMNVPDEILCFAAGEEVTVTVSGPPEDAIVFLHCKHNTSPLQYDGGAFVGTFTVMDRGAHSMGVQALAHDSIYDSEYPDDCLIWAVPYEVFEEPEE